MISHFVDVLEWGLLPVCIAGILLAGMDFKRQPRWKGYLIAGLILGALAGMASFYVQIVPNFINRSEHRYRLNYLILAFSLLVFALSFSASKDKKQQGLLAELRAIAAALFCGQSLLTCLSPIFLLTRDFVPYGGSFWETEVLVKLAGWCLGLAFLWLLFHAFRLTAEFSSGADQHSLRILLLGEIVLSLGEILLRLYSKGLLVRDRLFFELLAAVNNGRRTLTLLFLLGSLILPLELLIKAGHWSCFSDNPAERRKSLARVRSARRRAVLLVVLLLTAVLLLTVIHDLATQEVKLSEPEEYELSEKQALVDLSLLADGRLHRFAYQASGGEKMRFIALQKNPGSYVAALDACEICGASGYYERGNDVICKLCDVVMNRGTIGFAGGCNPIPLVFEIVGDHLLICREELESHAESFR